MVEDETSIREITQVALEAHGYQVLAASDGSEALALFVKHQEGIQVVITDAAMPIMDGRAVIRALQKLDPEIKVIVASGMDSEKAGREAGGRNVKAFLQKPFTARKLLLTLGEVLKEWVPKREEFRSTLHISPQMEGMPGFTPTE